MDSGFATPRQQRPEMRRGHVHIYNDRKHACATRNTTMMRRAISLILAAIKGEAATDEQ